MNVSANVHFCIQGTIEKMCQITQLKLLKTAGSKTIKSVKMIMMIMMEIFLKLLCFQSRKSFTGIMCNPEFVSTTDMNFSIASTVGLK